VSVTLQLASAPANQSAASAALTALVAAQAGVPASSVSITSAPTGRRHVLQQSGSAALLVHIGNLSAGNPGAVIMLQQQLQSAAMQAAASTALQVPVTGSSAAVDAVLVIAVAAATPAVSTAATTLLAVGAQPQLAAALQAASLPVAGITVLIPPQVVVNAPPTTPALPPPPLSSPPPPLQPTVAPPTVMPPSLVPPSESSVVQERLHMPAADVAAITVPIIVGVIVVSALMAYCYRKRSSSRRRFEKAEGKARLPALQIGVDSKAVASIIVYGSADDAVARAARESETKQQGLTEHPRMDFTAFVRRVSDGFLAFRTSSSDKVPVMVTFRHLSDGDAAMQRSSGHDICGTTARLENRNRSLRDEEVFPGGGPGRPGVRVEAIGGASPNIVGPTR
jgi:hypothetical protein